MTHGGLIIHGVDDAKNITGCPRSQNTLDRINRFAMECGVEVQVRAVRVDGLELTVTEVPEVRGRIVTTPNGRLLRRVGGDSQPLRGDAMVRFVRDRAEHPGEEEEVAGFADSDVDLAALGRVLEADGRAPAARGQALRALVDLGVALPREPSSDPHVLRAAAVLFAKDPAKFVQGAVVQLVRRVGTGPGPGPSIHREEYSGPLSDVVDRCEKFVARHTNRYEAVTGSRRVILPEYPAAAVREAILNALAHRDYGLPGATVDITVWDDRLEVQSPGPLPGHITVENMREEHYSRNRRIMRVLKTMGLVEEYGEGVDRMFEEMESRLMEPPIFNATPSSVTVTLRNRFRVRVEDQMWLSLLGRAELTVAERHVLVAVQRERSASPRRLRSMLPWYDIKSTIRGAVAKGLLVRVGERGGSRYELSDEVLLRVGSRGIEAHSRKRQLLLDAMDSRGSISTVEGAAILREGVPAVRQLLHDLIRSGLVRSRGRTRGTRYFRT